MPFLRSLNRDRILEVLGTGQHVAAFSKRFPQCSWYPSDYHDESLASINAYRLESNLSNFAAPRRIDLEKPDTLDQCFDSVLAINLFHITSWAAVEGTFRLAEQALVVGGALVTYGPYRHLAFCVQRRIEPLMRCCVKNEAWGVRDVEVLAQKAPLDLFWRRCVCCPPTITSWFLERCRYLLDERFSKAR